MKKTRTNMKENVFGIQERTPGQNLMRAVTNSDQPIGIPPYNYDQMLVIMRKALDPDEVDLLCRGYGFYCERKLQKEISAELGVDPKEVSVRAHRAVEKLQASPFKMQLRKLVPSLEELFAAIEAYDDLDASVKAIKELEHRYDDVKARLRQSEDACDGLESENARLAYDLEAVGKKLTAAETQLAEARNQVIREMARAEAVQKAFNATMESAKVNFAAAVASAEINSAGTFEGLGLSKEALSALSRIGVNTLKGLCNMSDHALSRLGVGSKNLAEIKRRLKESGLSLRAG